MCAREPLIYIEIFDLSFVFFLDDKLSTRRLQVFEQAEHYYLQLNNMPLWANFVYFVLLFSPQIAARFFRANILSGGY